MPGLQKASLSIKRFADRAIIENIVGLYVIQIAGYALPLVTIPYLSRTFAPAGFGAYLFCLSIALWASTIIEYGFNLSAARDVSRAREEPKIVKSVVSNVLGTKAILTFLALVGELFMAAVVPMFHSGYLLLPTLIYSMALGFSSNWYFQGKERLLRVSLVDLLSRALGTVAIFFFVHGPGDVWKAMTITSISSWVSTGVPMLWMIREVGISWPTWRSVWRTLTDGWYFFLYRSVNSLYSSVGTFVIGVLGASYLVGYYGGAEKLVRACLTFFTPVIQSLYPRLSFLLSRDRPHSQGFFRFWFIVMLGMSVLMFTVLSLGASTWITLFVGIGYDRSVFLLQILAGLIPVSTVSTFLMLNLFASGRERLVVCCSSITFIGNLLFMPLALQFGSIEAVAWISLTMEVVQMALLVWVFSKGRRLC